ncbi:oligopeptide transport system permease protein [Labedella gwakjiensis]|uniref:ABC transporter permease n=1 Tax=Labedella gwakjiensis TaxID=390269 RepID=A0A2P8GZA0_9MICO|nr:ABC transporter permease [Labedella gwakjiensis]PSL39291.1 oligopeptide transport system permease protein [Labedella gwakjiensis]RUQ86286.1 ABC transporter permease [Labedella gwakjiensis]
MIRFVGRRAVELAIVFVGVTFIIYLMVFTLPGDPIAALGGDRPLPEAVQAQLRAQYHLDEPVWLQYLRYVGGLFTGDLGTGFDGRPVGDRMAARWPVTITLALTAWAIEVVIGVVLGLVAGLRSGGLVDRTVLVGTVLATSIPVFVLGVTAQLVFGLQLGWFPIAGTSAGWPTAYLLPAIVIALFGLASVTRLMRGSVVDTMRSDFVRTLTAKGMPRRNIVGVHVMRNSVAPVLTFLAIDLGYLLGGTVVIEAIFNLPGIGALLFDAIKTHEGPTVVGVATALILIFLATSVVVDLINSVLDPRIRHE